MASGLVALLVGAGYALLLRAVIVERDSARRALASQEVLTVANTLERLVLDLETGQRGFFITREERFLEPWKTARAEYPRIAAELRRLASGPAQKTRAERIAAEIDSYLHDYSIPLLRRERSGTRAASGPATLDDGKRRVDDIRAAFDGFFADERGQSRAADARASQAARRALLAASFGLAASILLIGLFGAYVVRALVAPVRRAAAMAGRLAGGDLSTRMPETSPAEVGDLERAFNTMARSLDTSQESLRQFLLEQAALRRVATLVAHGGPAEELFGAAAREVRELLDADMTALVRFDDDETATIVASDSRAGIAIPAGERFPLEGTTVTTNVFHTGAAARFEVDVDSPGPVAAAVREAGVRSAVGAPIVVEGSLWGTMNAAWKAHDALDADVERRMTHFTDLIATAVANAQSRAELTASRARVVAAADETRRRIERDLHDGAQQGLVHTIIMLKLAQRALRDAERPDVELVGEALEHAEHAMADLRELAHGILPSALSRGGLRAGISNLVSRLPFDVSLDVTAERLPAVVEATTYFIVAEALTNAVKHAKAEHASVTVAVHDSVVDVEVRDDGVGGARVDGSSGLLGLQDRAAALNGELRVESPPGGGTVVVARLPRDASLPSG